MVEDGNGRATYREVVEALDGLRTDIMQRIDQLECKIEAGEQRNLERFRLRTTCDKVHESIGDKLKEMAEDIDTLRKREVALLTGLLIIAVAELVARFG